MTGPGSPQRWWSGIPRWALVTISVLFTLLLIVTAFALGLASTRSPSSDTAGVTVTPRPSAISTPRASPVVTEAPTVESSAGPTPEPVVPVTEPVAPPAAAPQKPVTVCPVGRLSGGVVGATVGPGPISTMPRINVTAYVRNDSNTRVILFRNDTPDVRGYDATGGVPIIELSGTWANTARDTFAIQPGETLTYVTAWDVTQQQLDAVVALYASPDIGSLVAAWPTTEQLAFCRSPLPNAGSGTDFPY